MRWLIILTLLGFYSLYGEENFILINGKSSRIIIELGPHLDERTTPASTFKIALSLMGFDKSILQNEFAPIWDFQEGYDNSLESWRISQTPKSWITCSCVWYSKKLALELGAKTMKHYLALFEYGNQDLSGGSTKPGSKNPPWISSSLKISPKEEVFFVQKMLLKKLPVSKAAVEMTKKLLLKEDFLAWKLFGKTGLGKMTGKGKELQVSWFVGWLETPTNFFPFAYQLRDEEISASQTVPRVKQLLRELILEKCKKESS